MSFSKVAWQQRQRSLAVSTVFDNVPSSNLQCLMIHHNSIELEICGHILPAGHANRFRIVHGGDIELLGSLTVLPQAGLPTLNPGIERRMSIVRHHKKIVRLQLVHDTHS